MQHPGWRSGRGRIERDTAGDTIAARGSTNDAFGTRRRVDDVRVVARPRAGCDEGTPKRRRSRDRGRKGGDFCRREGGADASGARGALGNSPAARAFATRGAVAPILPAKETVRAAILTLRVCVLKWMTAGGQKSSWRPLFSSCGWLARISGGAGARWERSFLALDFVHHSEPVLKKSKKKRFGTETRRSSSPKLSSLFCRVNICYKAIG